MEQEAWPFTRKSTRVQKTCFHPLDYSIKTKQKTNNLKGKIWIIEVRKVFFLHLQNVSTTFIRVMVTPTSIGKM